MIVLRVASIIEPPERPEALIELSVLLSWLPSVAVPAGTAIRMEPPEELPEEESAVNEALLGRVKEEVAAIKILPPG